jgi:hypothetical protein
MLRRVLSCTGVEVQPGLGHVAISLGNGSIISTDATGPGVVGVIDAKVPTNKWGHPYLGWSIPYFQGKEATSQLGNWTGSTSANDASYTGTQISADAVTTGFLTPITDVINFLMMSGIWFAEIGIGIALIGFGVVVFVKGSHE